MNTNSLHKVKKLILQGQTERALNSLYKITKNHPRYEAQVTLLYSQFSELKDHRIKNLLTEDQYSRTSSRIKDAALSITTDLEREVSNKSFKTTASWAAGAGRFFSDTFRHTKPKVWAGKKSRTDSMPMWILGIAVLVFFVSLAFIFSEGNIDANKHKPKHGTKQSDTKEIPEANEKKPSTILPATPPKGKEQPDPSKTDKKETGQTTGSTSGKKKTGTAKTPYQPPVVPKVSNHCIIKGWVSSQSGPLDGAEVYIVPKMETTVKTNINGYFQLVVPEQLISTGKQLILAKKSSLEGKEKASCGETIRITTKD